MTPLETRIYTHPPVPLGDITPLEMLVLTHVLECSEAETGLVLFTDVGPINPIHVKRQKLFEAYRSSAAKTNSALNIFVADRVMSLLPSAEELDAEAMVEIDLSEFAWQSIVQDIVARSPDLPEVTVIQWMNHPSQRPETYGASISLITANAIHHATSADLLSRFRLRDQALGGTALVVAQVDGDPAGDGPRSLTVGEVETALCIWESMLYFRGLHEERRPVPESVARMSELWDEVGWVAMRMCVLDIVPLAQEAYATLAGALEEGGFTFDFDFIPAVVETLSWLENGPDLDGGSEDLLDRVMAVVKRRRRDVAAKVLAKDKVFGVNPAGL